MTRPRTTTIRTIDTRDDLAGLAARLRVRPDWHEPDEQQVSARVIGERLDNAMGAAVEPGNVGEFNVVIAQNGRDVAVVNLATLLAFASGTYSG